MQRTALLQLLLGMVYGYHTWYLLCKIWNAAAYKYNIYKILSEWLSSQTANCDAIYLSFLPMVKYGVESAPQTMGGVKDRITASLICQVDNNPYHIMPVNDRYMTIQALGK